jgi:phytoene synthase
MSAFPDIGEPDLKLPPQGSAVWHALLFTPAPKRLGLAAAAACHHEIAATVRATREDVVTTVRLGWWREETGLLAQGRPRHPATRHLAQDRPPPNPCFAALAAPLSTLIDAADRDWRGTTYEDLPALVGHCEEDGGALYELIRQATHPAPADADTIAALRLLGAADRLVGIIRAYHQDAVDGRRYLPPSLLPEQAGALSSMTPELRQALTAVAECARNAFREGVERLPAEEREPCAPLLVLAALRARLLQRLALRRFDVIGYWTELRSISKLTTAWNTARRSLRGRPPRLAGITL